MYESIANETTSVYEDISVFDNAEHLPELNDILAPTDLVKLFSYIITWIRVLFIPLICCGNLMTILVIIKNEHMRTYTNVFIVSLACCDLLVGGFFLPITGLQLIYGEDIYMNKLYSLTMKGPYFYTLHMQMANLLTIAVDRLIAIVFPFRYQTLVNRKSVTVVLFLLWVLPLPGPIFYMFFWNT